MKKIILIIVLLLALTSLAVGCAENETKYTIFFHSNGGSDVEQMSIEKYSELVMPEEPEKEGYVFMGWFLDDETFLRQFYINSFVSITNKKDIDLFAKWELQKFSVKFYGEGGILVSGSTVQTIKYGEYPSQPVFAKTGHTFVGWDNDITFIKSNLEVKALYEVNQYTATFENDGGVGDIASVTVNYGELADSGTVPLKDGFLFGGYFSSPKGAGVQYYNSEMTCIREWDIAENTTLYAKWYHEVVLDNQGGSGNLRVEAVLGEPMPIVASPNLALFTFRGYFTQPEGGGIQYYDENMQSVKNWMLTGGLTLYALWEESIYTITFDKQGGSGGTDSFTLRYLAAMPEASAPQNLGYIFRGYFSQINGGGTRYYDEEMFSSKVWEIDDDAVLYAYWELVESTVGLIFTCIENNKYAITGYNGTDTEIIIPYKHLDVEVVEIADNAFYNNYIIKNISIPSSVVKIGEKAFYNCLKLKSVDFPTDLTVLGSQAFSGCLSLESVSIPETLNEIPDSAFKNCRDLSDVVISSGVIEIKDSAFSDCTSLTTITIPNSVVSIGNNAFLNCIYLDILNLSSSLLFIGDSAFMNCLALEKIMLPEGIINIGEKAFYGSSIYNVNIPETIIFIGDRAFYTIWMHNVFIKRNRPFTIGTNVFEENTYIYTPDAALNNYKSHMGWKEYINIYSENDIDSQDFLIIKEKLMSYTGEAETIVIPKTVRWIADDAFKGARGKIEFENESPINAIEQKSFAYYNGSEIIIGENVITIDGKAFDYAKNLESITLPSELETIGEKPFEKNIKLKNIYLDAVSVPDVYGDYNYSDINVYVPLESITDYINHPFWKQFNILPIN